MPSSAYTQVARANPLRINQRPSCSVRGAAAATADRTTGSTTASAVGVKPRALRGSHPDNAATTPASTDRPDAAVIAGHRHGSPSTVPRTTRFACPQKFVYSFILFKWSGRETRCLPGRGFAAARFFSSFDPTLPDAFVAKPRTKPPNPLIVILYETLVTGCDTRSAAIAPGQHLFLSD